MSAIVENSTEITALSSPSPALAIRLLGPFELFVDGAPISADRWPRRKPKLLVKLLALQPGRQLHREQIIDLLWPDADFDAAANNLHKAIHAARRALEPDLKSGPKSRFIIIRDNLVALSANGGLHIDAEEFESLASDALRFEDPRAFEAALNLYRGDLLPEDLYEEWAVAPRERLQGIYADLLFRLSRLREESDDYVAGIGLLRKLVAVDPTNEEAQQRLMRLQARIGNLRGATEQYRQFVQILRSEAGVEPDRTTVELYETISARMTNDATPQEEITREFAEESYQILNGVEKQTLKKYDTRNEEALELYLKGRYCWLSRSGKRMLQAVGYFEQAIAKDPGYALAWSGLADAYNLLASYGVLPPVAVCGKAMEAARRAIELAPDLAEAHAAMGYLQLLYLWKFDAGRESFRRAVELKPRDPILRQWYGASIVATSNEVEAGLSEIRRSLQIDPVSVLNRGALGWILFFARRYDEAIEEVYQALELDSNLLAPHLFGGRAFCGVGKFEEAVERYQQAVILSNGDLAIQAELIATLALAGDRGAAARLLDELQVAASGKYLSSCQLALVHLALGNDQAALDALEMAYRERAGHFIWLNIDPRLDRLRDYAQFRDLLRRLGF